MDDWDSIYKKYGSRVPVCDDWLDKFLPVIDFSRDVPVIDLGCGYGNDTLYLTRRGFPVISCDFSIEALNRLDSFIKNPMKRHFDMREGLPFQDDSARIVISDLSLHYFSKADTEMIIREISRVLEPGGFLICRINSTNDVNHGAGQGEMLEENFYNYEGNLKRFFDRDSIKVFFAEWEIGHINECVMTRYKKEKIVWEFTAENRKGSI